MLLPLLSLSVALVTPTSGVRPGHAVPPIADLFVDGAQPNCASGTGSAAQPVCSISAAVALAASGDTIRIAPGTYVENIGIGTDLELIGVGGPDVTIIDGGGAGSVIVVSVASTVRIQGVTLTNGSAPFGGGILFEGDLTLLNSTITGNVATTISGGGGIASFNGGSTLSVLNSEISSNQAPMGYGGGVMVSSADCTIHRTTVSGNMAGYYGGGVHMAANNFTDYTLQITDSTISGNQTLGGSGGGVFAGGVSLILSGSTVSGNSANFSGGGIELFGSGCDIVNSTISGNVAEYGGGIKSLGNARPRLLSNVTITENTATMGAGGGIFTTGITADIEMGNSIISGNTMLDTTLYPLTRRDTWGSFSSLGHNLVGAGATGITNGVMNDLVGTSIGGVSLMLGPLQLNGGPTATHALLPGSPAIDAGNPVTFASVDQRGATRPQGAAPDIGAYELGTIGSDDLCNGDGGDGGACTPCACANSAAPGTLGGCLNSTGMSARLTRSGTASLSTMDLRYEAEGLPANSTAILLSASAVAPANPANPCFGSGSGLQAPTLDGLRCVVQNLLRHGVRPADANGRIGVTTNGWGAPSALFNSAAFTLGETRFFQVVYREDPAFVCQTGLNSTQASSVTFVP